MFLQQNVAVAFLKFTSAIITLSGEAWLMGRKEGEERRAEQRRGEDGNKERKIHPGWRTNQGKD